MADHSNGLDIYDELGAALLVLVILAFFVERALAPIFDWKRISQQLSDHYLRVPVAVAISIGLCFTLNFDIIKPLGTLIPGGIETRFAGFNIFLTGLIVSGGSAGALKLMQDVLGITKKNRDLAKRVQEARQKAQIAQANKDLALATSAEERAKAEMAVAENLIRASHLELVEREAAASARLRSDIPGIRAAAPDLTQAQATVRIGMMMPELKARAGSALAKAKLLKASSAMN